MWEYAELTKSFLNSAAQREGFLRCAEAFAEHTHRARQGGGHSVKHAFKHHFLPKGNKELRNWAR